MNESIGAGERLRRKTERNFTENLRKTKTKMWLNLAKDKGVKWELLPASRKRFPGISREKQATLAVIMLFSNPLSVVN